MKNNKMHIMELMTYDHEKNCFVAKDNRPTHTLSPFEWQNDPRPSIFLQDPRFRTRNGMQQVKLVVDNPKPFFPYNDTLKDK
jgi:hypothetical protein